MSAVSYEKLFDVLLAFCNEKNYYDLLNTVLSKMMEVTCADAGTLYVVENDKLDFCIMRNCSLDILQCADDDIKPPPLILDEDNAKNINVYSAIKNEIVCVDDIYDSDKFDFSQAKQYDEVTGYCTRSMLVFPLITTANSKSEIIGVIQLINARNESGTIIPFGDVYDPAMLIALSNISANSLSNLQYAREIDELFGSFVGVLTAAIDERSPYNSNHTNKVALYCDAFVKYLNGIYPKGHRYHFEENRRDQLVMAAYLHDIGKIIIPLYIMDKSDRLSGELSVIKLKFAIKRAQLENSLLRGDITKAQYNGQIADLDEAFEFIIETNKADYLSDDVINKVRGLEKLQYVDAEGNTTGILSPSNIESLMIRKGTFTTAERLMMQEHVSLTGRLLEKMKFNKYYRNVPEWARSHHEFLDGTGYPAGLMGDEIPPEVCILTLMDIFEALTTSDRPYRNAMPVEKAIIIINAMAKEGKLDKVLVGHLSDSKIWLKRGM